MAQYVFRDENGSQRQEIVDPALLGPVGLFDLSGRYVRFRLHALQRAMERFDKRDYAEASRFLVAQWRGPKTAKTKPRYEAPDIIDWHWRCSEAVLVSHATGAVNDIITVYVPKDGQGKGDAA